MNTAPILPQLDDLRPRNAVDGRSASSLSRPADVAPRLDPELLWREHQHRTSNLLQYAAALLEHRAGLRGDLATRAQFAEVARSFRLLVDAHRLLSPIDPRRPADIGSEVRACCEGLAAAFGAAAAEVTFTLDIAPAAEGLRHEVPSGLAALVLTELVTNAYKHAFRDRDAGVVAVLLGRDGGGAIVLEVRDDGAGIADPERLWTGGLGIVRSLLRAVGGELRIASEQGLRAHVAFAARAAEDPLSVAHDKPDQELTP